MAAETQAHAFVVVTASAQSSAGLPTAAGNDGRKDLLSTSTDAVEGALEYGVKHNADEKSEEINLPRSRIEQLLEQQNTLMLRHLELAEENRKHTESVKSMFRRPQDILDAVDPSLRGFFKEWRNDFRAKLKLYVSQSDTANAYNKATANGDLIKPFSVEAKKTWQWTQFYRTIAKPIDGIDPMLANGTPIGLADADGNVRATPSSPENSNPYDIDAAFAELRKRHAQEIQVFIVAHQKACVERLVEELSVSHQMKTLQDRLAAYEGFSNSQAKQYAEQQAENFVEFVYREEMSKVEKRINEGRPTTIMTISTVIRIILVVAILLSISLIDHERLTRLFAFIFALVCGLALLWEEPVLSSVQHVLGGAPERLRSSSPALAWSSDGIADLFLSSSTGL